MIISWYICLLFLLFDWTIINGAFWSSKEHKNKKNNDVTFYENANKEAVAYYPINVSVLLNGDSENGLSVLLTKENCEQTLDLTEVICPLINFSAPCKLFSNWGTRVSSCSEINTNDVVHVLHEDRLFMWAGVDIGNINYIKHIALPTKDPIILETISIYPRVFKVSNFFTNEEAEYLTEFLYNNNHLIKSNNDEYIQRSNDILYDENSPTSYSIKRRAFDLLGIFPYDESYADGLYIMRYNQTNAYAPHFDYIDGSIKMDSDHNYDSTKNGTNRFASLLLYLSDVEEGGQTVFTEIGYNVSIDSNQIDRNIKDLFKPNSWEENMLVDCYTKLSVKPKKLEALLFYNQLSNGEIDLLSKHGGCPVLEGTKIVANLYIWNGPKEGYAKLNLMRAVSVSFECTKDVKGASLYWENSLWEEMVAGRPIKVNSFPGHNWKVYVNGDHVVTWTIDGTKSSQRYVVTLQDLPTYNSKKVINPN